MDWVKRINKVLDYIEENLDGEISDDTISLLFASPQGMFQRIFANITDMTLSEYIRKRRLTQAAVDIHKTDVKIIDVAVKYGYNSAAAFGSAFKSFHGMAPSDARKSDAQPKSFQRFAFTLVLSRKGADSMQYYNTESAEFLMQQMVDREHKRKHFQSISTHNGVKCACDGYRALVMLPEGVADWDLADAYFETDEAEAPRLELNSFFSKRDEDGLSFNLTKEQVALMLVSIDGAKTEHKRKYVSLPAAGKDEKTQDALVCIDMNSMGIITEATVNHLKEKAGEPVMGFNIRFIEEALKFIMCSDNENIEIYHNGNLSALILKSGRLYAMVLPVKLKDDVA